MLHPYAAAKTVLRASEARYVVRLLRPLAWKIWLSRRIAIVQNEKGCP
jgi:hypothetical protein